MRAATVFVNAAAKYQSDIIIDFCGKSINGKSIMNIMAACIKYKSRITVICSGKDEKAALSEAAAIIKSGFGEE